MVGDLVGRWLCFFDRVGKMSFDSIYAQKFIGPLHGFLAAHGDDFLAPTDAVPGVVSEHGRGIPLASKEESAGSVSFVKGCRPVAEIPLADASLAVSDDSGLFGVVPQSFDYLFHVLGSLGWVPWVGKATVGVKSKSAPGESAL